MKQMGHWVDRYVGQQIREVRRARGLSQGDLGRQVGVTFQQVQKYERGVNRVSCSRLVQLAEALGVPSGELLPRDNLAAEVSDAHRAR